MLQDRLRGKEKKKEEGDQQSAAVTFLSLFSYGYEKGSYKPEKKKKKLSKRETQL